MSPEIDDGIHVAAVLCNGRGARVPCCFIDWPRIIGHDSSKAC
jgi:hypothetical protein